MEITGSRIESDRARVAANDRPRDERLPAGRRLPAPLTRPGRDFAPTDLVLASRRHAGILDILVTRIASRGFGVRMLK
jgi:hypothetical protein